MKGQRVLNKDLVCSHEGCHRPVHCKLLCRTHYAKTLNGICALEGCSNIAHGGAHICHTHMGRYRKYGSYDKPITVTERGVEFPIQRFYDVAKRVLTPEVFNKLYDFAKSSTPLSRMGRIQLTSQTEEAPASSWIFNEEDQNEYWYMNLKDRDFIERDSAAMNNLPF